MNGDSGSPIKGATRHVDIQKKIGRAMQVCADVAKLYKKHGKPPVYVSTTGFSNRAKRRKEAK